MELGFGTILIMTIVSGLSILDGLSFGLLNFGNCIVACIISGMLVGDVQYGLIVGGTLQMTQLGVGTYGGASVLNITQSGMITTALGATTGAEPVAFAVSIGLALAALFVQLDILARFSNTFFQHLADGYVKKGDTKGIRIMNNLGAIPWGLSRALPVFFFLMFGQPFVDTIMRVVPQWLMGGFKVAGGLLPVVGFTILMRYLPVAKKPQFLVLGFVLAAYLNVPILGIALFGLVAAIITFQSETQAPATVAGGDDDE